MLFKNKVIIITGGANGIGEAMVEYFIKEGANVATIDKEEIQCKENMLAVQGDISKQEELDQFIDQVIKTYKRIDILINNACYSNKGLLSNCSYEDFNEILYVGVSAPYYLTKLAMPHFQKNACIINIASTRSMQSQADWESYSAAKGAIVSLTHAMSVSLRGKVRVNCVSPGWIDTIGYEASEEDKNQHTVERVGKTNDIVQIISFLCREESSFINGQNITVDGGMGVQMIYHNDEGWKYTSKE